MLPGAVGLAEGHEGQRGEQEEGQDGVVEVEVVLPRHAQSHKENAEAHACRATPGRAAGVVGYSAAGAVG